MTIPVPLTLWQFFERGVTVTCKIPSESNPKIGNPVIGTCGSGHAYSARVVDITEPDGIPHCKVVKS